MTVKAPEETRLSILKAAFEEIHKIGFRGASLNHIVENAGISKGALFHHFADKQALGYAVVDELIFPEFKRKFVEPMETGNPIDRIKEILHKQFEMCCGDPEMMEKGCPLNNLAQEMSFTDSGFRERINDIYEIWRHALSKAFERGIQNNQIKSTQNPEEIGAFIVATFAGLIGASKCACDTDLTKQITNQLINY